MRKIVCLLAAALLGTSACFAQHIGTEYRLKKVIPVDGRQGIAIDNDYYYVSDTRALYKYDKQGNLIMKNDAPFTIPNWPITSATSTSSRGKSIPEMRSLSMDAATTSPSMSTMPRP